MSPKGCLELPEVENGSPDARAPLGWTQDPGCSLSFSPGRREGSPEGDGRRTRGGSAFWAWNVRVSILFLNWIQGWITVHLRMTGKLLIDGERSPWTRAVIELDNGSYPGFSRMSVKSGRMLWSREFPAAAGPGWGPDALELSATDFVTILRGRRASLKPLLLNQQVLRRAGQHICG